MKIKCMKCGKMIKLEFKTFSSNVALYKKCKRENTVKAYINRLKFNI